MPQSTFDHSLIAQNLLRSAHRDEAGFLMDFVAGELSERLMAVERTFTDAVDLASPGEQMVGALRRSGKAHSLQRIDPAGLLVDFASQPHEPLPLSQGSVDLIVSALGLQFANDLPGILWQIRHSLRPDGLFLAAFPGGETLNELRQCLIEAESHISGGASPRIAPMIDLRDAGALLQRAGFALPVIDREKLTVRYKTLPSLMSDLRAMGAANPLSARARKPAPAGLFSMTEAIYRDRHGDPDGKIRATFDIIFLSGWAPHESQQKPLAPGSARMSLAKALAGDGKDGEPNED